VGFLFIVFRALKYLIIIPHKYTHYDSNINSLRVLFGDPAFNRGKTVCEKNFVSSKSSFPRMGREVVIGQPPANGSDRSVGQTSEERNA